jgi:hypothetical protein
MPFLGEIAALFTSSCWTYRDRLSAPVIAGTIVVMAGVAILFPA